MPKFWSKPKARLKVLTWELINRGPPPHSQEKLNIQHFINSDYKRHPATNQQESKSASSTSSPTLN